jgi:hypothetical protein
VLAAVEEEVVVAVEGAAVVEEAVGVVGVVILLRESR